MKHVCLCLLAVLCCVSSAWAQTAVDHTLGLYGCWVMKSAQAADGRIQMVTCYATPRALYYTLNFGESWSLASGGLYTSGTVNDLVMTNDYAFITTSVNGQATLLRAALPAGGATSWTPDWQQISLDIKPLTLALNGSRLYASGLEESIVAINAATGGVVDTESFPDSLNKWKTMAADSDTVYAVKQADDTSGVLYKSTVADDGTLGSFTAVTAAGLPASRRLAYPFVAPNHALYISTYTTAGVSEKTWKSADYGASFTEILSGTTRTACFNGSFHMLGAYYSTDSGSTFSYLNAVQVGEISVKATDNGCAVNPTNPQQVMAGVWHGPIRTANFGASTVQWIDASTGMEGASAYSIAQLASNKARVVVATTNGIAATDNFTAATPSWDWTCPGEVCYQWPQVAADPSDNTVFYVSEGSTYYKGVVTVTSGKARFTWSELFRSGQTGEVGAIRLYDFLPNTLIYSQNGVFFRSTADGSLIKSGAGLDGKYTGDLLALNASRMFVTVGFVNETGPTDASRGIYASSDGGTSWSEMQDADLGTHTYFTKFAYDSSADILYAISDWATGATDPSKVFYLENAAAGGTDWKASTAQLGYVKAIAVDNATHKVYAATDDTYVSTDKGLSFTKILDGLQGETVYLLYFDALVKGSNGGLHAIDDETPTPTCSLSAPGYRSGRKTALPRGFSFRVRYSGTQTTGALQTRTSAGGTWRNLKSFRIKNQKATVARVLKKPVQVRAHMSDCDTNTITVKKAKRG